jgi:hypothetical protein
MSERAQLVPPTTDSLFDDAARPYFVWWTDVTVGEFKQRLREGEPAERAYWLGALLREANSRDVWVFTTPAEVRALWPHVTRYLGKARARWAWLLDLEDRGWPPAEALLG